MMGGMESLERKLKELEGISVAPGVKKGISLVQEGAKLGCPAHDGELRQNIFTSVEEAEEMTTGLCCANKSYAPYVELGTGPKGQASHAGISPHVDVAYTQSPWWIHESKIGRETAEHYHFFHIDTENGRFYQCTGQPAQPFLYPALKNNEERVTEIIQEGVKEKLKGIVK